MSEEWGAVPGFEGLYEVSDLGRRYGVSPATVRDAVLRRTWAHV